MALNKECIGHEYPAISTEVTLEAMQNYARAYNDDNPAFFDASRIGGIVAPPMYAVAVTWDAVMGAAMDPKVGADLLRSVHGEQDMEFIKPIRAGDVITSVAKIASIETKLTGETMTIEVNARDRDGAAVQKTLFSIFVRGRRNREVTAAEPRIVEPERGEPEYTVAQTIDKDQTFRYAQASGDRNPIHVDENIARMAGLPGIIVHGLCTMAFTSKVAIDRLCSGEPTRLKRLRARFSRPVLPGQTITTRVWRDGEENGRQIFAYETLNPDGHAVIKGGIAEVAD
jgi:acyl dehydratase